VKRASVRLPRRRRAKRRGGRPPERADTISALADETARRLLQEL